MSDAWPSIGDVHAGMEAGDASASDTSSTPAPSSTPEPAPAPEPAPSAAAPPPEPSAEDVFAAELGDGESFPRGLVEKLRNEGAKYRTQLRQYEDVFSRDEVNRDVWLDMASRWAQGDERGVAELMRNISSSVLDDGDVTTPIADPAKPAETPPAAGGEQKPLTMDDVDRRVDERLANEARRKAEDQAVTSVHDEIREGGYDPESVEGIQAMWFASRPVAQGGTGGDVKAAVAKLKARDQAIIDRFVESKRDGGAGPSPAPQQGVVATGNETRQDFPKRSDVDAFLRARREAQPGH